LEVNLAAALGCGSVCGIDLGSVPLILWRQRGNSLKQFSGIVNGLSDGLLAYSHQRSNASYRGRAGTDPAKVTMVHRCDCGGSPLLPKDAMTERRGEAQGK